MARTFASGDVAVNAGAPVTGLPATLFARYKGPQTVSGTLLHIDNGTVTHRLVIYAMADETVIARQSTSASGSRSAQTVATSTADTWSSAAGVFITSSNRWAYVNGGNKVQNVQPASSMATPTAMRIGKDAAGLVPFVGDYGEAAVWNIALSDAEIALLHSGILPIFVQRANLVAWWPMRGLVSPEPDLVGSFPLTLTGTTEAAAHPPVIYPQRALGMRRMAA